MTTPTPHPAVQAARAWLGTPYHHQARLRGVGVDCVGLVLGVARELGAVNPDWDVPGYSRVPDGLALMHHLRQHLQELPRSALQPGDVVCVAFDRHPQHVGVVGDYLHGGLSFIHASGHRGEVIETRLMFSAAMRFVAGFRWPQAGQGVA